MEHKRERFLDALQDCPVIAALKSDEGLEKAIASDCTTVFFLYGTILNIASHVERVKQAGKIVFVHADLIEGLTGFHRAEHAGGRHHFDPPEHHPPRQGARPADHSALFPVRLALV